MHAEEAWFVLEFFLNRVSARVTRLVHRNMLAVGDQRLHEVTLALAEGRSVTAGITRESLVKLLHRHAIAHLPADDVDHMSRVWHRLDPWPDVLEGLALLKRSRIIAPCSNGNIALMVNMARRAGLPWDCILGAETARAYKPLPEAYLASCRQLGLRPAEVMMVAAHNNDLKAAKAQGLATAFVARPNEHGHGQTSDLAPDGSCVDIAAIDFADLARQLG